jgi:hypothetical protein
LAFCPGPLDKFCTLLLSGPGPDCYHGIRAGYMAIDHVQLVFTDNLPFHETIFIAEYAKLIPIFLNYFYRLRSSRTGSASQK